MSLTSEGHRSPHLTRGAPRRAKVSKSTVGPKPPPTQPRNPGQVVRRPYGATRSRVVSPVLPPSLLFPGGGTVPSVLGRWVTFDPLHPLRGPAAILCGWLDRRLSLRHFLPTRTM